MRYFSGRKLLTSIISFSILVFPVVSSPSAFTQVIPASERSNAVLARVSPMLQKEVSQAGFTWGAPIFIRIFKETRQLEVWLQRGPRFARFRTYDVCTYGAGTLGPKTRRGDGQAPEGFYYVTPGQMNPSSDFHLSFNIGYPNRYDRGHGRTGSALMVHGDCVSIGCYAMTDTGIEEIFTLAHAAFTAGQPFFRVHIFPFPMTEENMTRHENNRWRSFWTNLRDGYAHFEHTRCPPNVEVKNKAYVFEPACPTQPQPAGAYTWLPDYTHTRSIEHVIPAPDGYHRLEAPAHSFAGWLRALPLKDPGLAVRLFNGARKGNQSAHFRIIDMDVGKKDLQQCADAVMRLRAEYLFAAKDHGAIHFNFTSGDTAAYEKWVRGYRPHVRGNTVRWHQSATRDPSYAGFRRYLDTVFTYAGSASLSREMRVVSVDEMRIGDVFIQGGYPGHAVIVVDMAIHSRTGKKLFLVAQSYMPAQEMHILNNPRNRQLTPWYARDFGDILETPEWTFRKDDLRRF